MGKWGLSQECKVVSPILLLSCSPTLFYLLIDIHSTNIALSQKFFFFLISKADQFPFPHSLAVLYFSTHYGNYYIMLQLLLSLDYELLEAGTGLYRSLNFPNLSFSCCSVFICWIEQTQRITQTDNNSKIVLIFLLLRFLH